MTVSIEAPACFKSAPTSEIIELTKVLLPQNGIFTTHMRNEAIDVIKSVQETIEISSSSNVRTVISHHKCAGRENWGNPVASDGKGEGRWVAGYAYDTNVDSGYFVIQLTAANFNTGNMVGFPKEAYTTGQTATIKVVGNVATGLSGLTPGKRYYVQFDGTLGTSSMLDNIVVAGQAISSTSLLIQSP